jgi:hypothetical protein
VATDTSLEALSVGFALLSSCAATALAFAIDGVIAIPLAIAQRVYSDLLCHQVRNGLDF